MFELVYRRQASRPNEIWQAGHTQLDLWVVTPAGTSARPWLTVIEDDHSRAVAGYAVNLGAPSALPTALVAAAWPHLAPGAGSIIAEGTGSGPVTGQSSAAKMAPCAAARTLPCWPAWSAAGRGDRAGRGRAYRRPSAQVYTRKWHESWESRWNVSADGEESILGKVGRVTVSIPADGPGEVLLPVRGGSEAFAAWSDEPIRRHRRIVVVECLSARSVFVTPVS